LRLVTGMKHVTDTRGVGGMTRTTAMTLKRERHWWRVGVCEGGRVGGGVAAGGSRCNGAKTTTRKRGRSAERRGPWVHCVRLPRLRRRKGWPGQRPKPRPSSPARGPDPERWQAAAGARRGRGACAGGPAARPACNHHTPRPQATVFQLGRGPTPPNPPCLSPAGHRPLTTSPRAAPWRPHSRTSQTWAAPRTKCWSR
jgi:hypothetical protein